MLGLFGTLNLGARSLSTQQQGTEIAGQNLANVNNPAYARQRLALQTSISIPSPVGPQGTGVESVAIVQIRSYWLDQQIQSESSVTGSLNAQQIALQTLQANLGEQIDTQATTSDSTGSQNGLSQGLSNLFNAFQSVSLDPSSLSERQVLIQTAQGLTSQFNQLSNRLDTVGASLDQSVQSDVGQSNQLLADIAKLNQQIIYSEASSGKVANDLRDARQAKIESLSKLVNITTAEQSNGGLDVSIGGVTMVSGVSQLDSLETYDAGGGQILVRAQTAGTPLTLTGGSIQGTIDVRDGALADLKSSTNDLAAQLISQVNSIYSAGYDLNGATGQNFFVGTDAATIGVNPDLLDDPSKFQASDTAGEAGNNATVLALAQSANGKITALNNQTFSQSYSTSVAKLGQTISNVNDQVDNHTVVSNMLSSQRDSISGVSIDEEMTDLMKYQKAFEASARLINVISEMLDTVVNLK